MSRRVISLAVAVALVAAMLPMQGCQLLGKLGVGGPTTQPFTTDYTVTQADYDFFVGSDTVDTAVVHSPFYAGNQPLPSQNTAEYEAARFKKVNEIIADADALVTAAKAAEPALATLRSDYIAFLDTVRTSEPKAADFVGSSMATMVAFGIDEILAERGYTALASTDATTSYASTMRDYLKVTRALEYGALLLEDGNVVALHAAWICQGIATDGSATSKAAVAEYDPVATKDVADAVAALQPVSAAMDRVNEGMSLLASGDYYFSREALGWMASETAKLKPQVDALAAGADLTQQQVDDIKAVYGAYAEWNATLTGQLASLDTSDLVAVDGAAPFGVMPWLQTAYAADGALYNPGADYASATAALSRPSTPSKPGLLSATWSGVKSVFGAVKTGIGVGLDVAAVGTKNLSTAGCNWWYGVPRSETWKQWKQNVKEIGKNYDAGVSGSQVLTDASGYLDAAEAGAGKTAGGWAQSGVEKIWGKGKIADATGWATGGLVKITTGMFTGMAKGIYKVANKQSSTTEVFTGFVEIGLSCIGGTKVLVRATKIPGLVKGGSQLIKTAGKAMVNIAESIGDAKVRAQLVKEMAAILANNKLTKEQVAKLISNSVKVEISQLVSSMMTRNREMYIKAIRDLIAAGGAAFKGNFVKTAKSMLSDMFMKPFKDKSLQGLLDAGTTAIGDGLGEYIDNLVQTQLDPMLIELINAALSIPPDPDQVDGTYSGAFVITKVDIPPEYTKEAKAANCAALFKQLEGKKQAITLKVSATGGSATMTSGSGSSKGSCEYADGGITMSFTSNGTTMSFVGTAKLTKQGVIMSGSFSMPYPKTKIMISGTWSVTKK
jgi:hypothetical protein